MTQIMTEGGKMGFYEIGFFSLQICPLCGPTASEWLLAAWLWILVLMVTSFALLDVSWLRLLGFFFSSLT